MRKSISNEVKAARIQKPSALDVLRQGAERKQVWNGKRRFDVEFLDGATVVGLLDAVAAASAGLLFGFNRSGGMNIVVLLEGDKETYTVYDNQEFTAIVAVIMDALWDYASEKYSDVAREVSGEAPLTARSEAG